MYVLVTGATGFIGSHIVRKLVQRGYRVKILLRKTSQTSNIDGLRVERVYGDILDLNSVKEALYGCDTLYHSAGLVSSKKKDYEKMEEININGTINVLSAAYEMGIEKVIYTSTIGAIGIDPSGKLADEETQFNLEALGIQYLITKHKAEMEAFKFYDKGLPVVIVNPSVVVGPGDIYLSSTAFVFWYCRKRFPGYMVGGGNLVDVEDVAEGHILAMEKGRPGERYILGNRNLSIKELFYLLEKVTGVPRPRLRIPYFLIFSFGYISERILRISSPSFVMKDVDSVRVGRLHWYVDSSKAIKDLGFPQTPIEISLERTVKWYKDNAYLDNI